MCEGSAVLFIPSGNIWVVLFLLSTTRETKKERKGDIGWTCFTFCPIFCLSPLLRCFHPHLPHLAIRKWPKQMVNYMTHLHTLLFNIQLHRIQQLVHSSLSWSCKQYAKSCVTDQAHCSGVEHNKRFLQIYIIQAIGIFNLEGNMTCAMFGKLE